MDADVFLKIIFSRALVLTVWTRKLSLAFVYFASVPHQAYFVLVATRTLIASKHCFLLLIFHFSYDGKLRQLLKQLIVLVIEINDFWLDATIWKDI
jgi:hypothetical protein